MSLAGCFFVITREVMAWQLAASSASLQSWVRHGFLSLVYYLRTLLTPFLLFVCSLAATDAAARMAS